MIDYLLRFTSFIDMFDTLLITTLFLLASLLVCLLSLRLSINIKHLYLFFHLFPLFEDFFQLPPFILTPPFIKVNKNLRAPAKFLKYVWSFYKIIHERVNQMSCNSVYISTFLILFLKI